MANPPNHDDLMMNLVLFAWFTTTDIFSSISDIDMKNMLYREQLQAIQDDMIPFGFIEGSRGDNRAKTFKDEDGTVWFEEETRNTGLF